MLDADRVFIRYFIAFWRLRRTLVELLMVPEKGIEPSRGVTPADFESAASTSSATPAEI